MNIYQPLIIVLLGLTILSLCYYNLAPAWEKIKFVLTVSMDLKKQELFYYIGCKYNRETKEVISLSAFSNAGLCSHQALVVFARYKQGEPLEDSETEILIEEVKELKKLMTPQQRQHIINELTKHLSE